MPVTGKFAKILVGNVVIELSGEFGVDWQAGGKSVNTKTLRVWLHTGPIINRLLYRFSDI